MDAPQSASSHSETMEEAEHDIQKPDEAEQVHPCEPE